MREWGLRNREQGPGELHLRPGLGQPSPQDPAWTLSFNTSSYWRTSHFPVLSYSMNEQAKTCIAAELNMVIWAGVKISARPEFRIWCGSRKQHFPFWYPKSGLTPTVALFLMPRSPVKARGTCRGYLGFRSVLWTASSENASEIMFFTAICDTWPLVCFCRLCAREKKAHLWLEGETQRGRIMLLFSFRIVFWVTA